MDFAGIAAIALRHDFQPDQAVPVKNGKDGPQRTGDSAKGPFAQYKPDQEAHQYEHAQVENHSRTLLHDRLSGGCVHRVPQKPGQGGGELARRTKIGKPKLPRLEGDDYCEEHQRQVFAVTPHSWDSILGGPDSVHQVLQEAEGTNPATRHPSHRHANQSQEPQQIKRDCPHGHEMLQSPDGAGEQRRGAGITVQEGHTDPFKPVTVDHFGHKRGNEAIGKDGAGCLDQSPEYG
jgi:hypothetical protein